MLPLAVAVATGIVVDHSRPGTIGGVGGSSLTVYPGKGELELVREHESLRWPATIRFGDHKNMLLGQIGFLEYFTATYDHSTRLLELIPNVEFPGRD